MCCGVAISSHRKIGKEHTSFGDRPRRAPAGQNLGINADGIANKLEESGEVNLWPLDEKPGTSIVPVGFAESRFDKIVAILGVSPPRNSA